MLMAGCFLKKWFVHTAFKTYTLTHICWNHTGAKFRWMIFDQFTIFVFSLNSSAHGKTLKLWLATLKHTEPHLHSSLTVSNSIQICIVIQTANQNQLLIKCRDHFLYSVKEALIMSCLQRHWLSMLPTFYQRLWLMLVWFNGTQINNIESNNAKCFSWKE